MISLLSFILAILASNSPAIAEDVCINRLGGTFIQYQTWMMWLGPQKWEVELDFIKQARLKKIYLQWHEFNESVFYSGQLGFRDPTEVISNYADQNNQEVYLGLRSTNTWWTSFDDPVYLKKTLKKDLSLARLLWKKYGAHASIKGWYIPYEISEGSYSEIQIKQLNEFFKSFTQGLKEISKDKSLSVSVSVFLKNNTSPETSEKMFSQIFANQAVDEIMLQDGVGVNSQSGVIKEAVVPYFDAFQRVAQKASVKIVPILEIFTMDSQNNREPAPLDQLKEQLALNYGSPKIAFDFFHYMSPNRGEKQKFFFEEYLSLIQSKVKALKPHSMIKSIHHLFQNKCE